MGEGIRMADLLLGYMRAAASLALVLHELATNAVKYGALSTPQGRLKVAWQVTEEQIVLIWSERGGPPAEAPRQEGFGSQLARQTVRGPLNGELACEWRSKGLQVTVTLPLEQLRG